MHKEVVLRIQGKILQSISKGQGQTLAIAIPTTGERNMTGLEDGLMTSEEAGVLHRFEVGISLLGDWEGHKLTNHQIPGEHAAERIKSIIGSSPLLEVCTGIGATTFVLARCFPFVYGIERDERRISLCKHNLVQLGLADKVALITGDALEESTWQSIPHTTIRAAYTDVAWRRSGDWRIEERDITATSPNTQDLFTILTRHGIRNICMKLSKLSDVTQLRRLGDCEVEYVFADGELSFIFVYFGDLVRSRSSVFTFSKHAFRQEPGNSVT